MTKAEWKRVTLTAVAAGGVVMAGAVAWRYVDSTYLSLKEAQSIIQKLSSDDPAVIGDGLYEIQGFSRHYLPDGKRERIPLPNHKPLRGAGEEKVKELQLDILRTATNRNVLGGILLSSSPELGGVDLANHSDEARSVITVATERYNAEGGRESIRLSQREDGRWRIDNFFVRD